MPNLSESTILSTFDELVRDGVLAYGPYEVVEEDCEGYPIEFRICPSLRAKPPVIGATLSNTQNPGRPFGPGSDMFCPDPRLLIASLNSGTHSLAFNLFCADRPQLLLLTADSFKRQHEALDLDDFAAILETLRSLKDMYVIYNGGEKAGCSRVHKHIQALRGQPRAFEIFKSVGDAKSVVPFVYYIFEFTDGFDAAGPKGLLARYTTMLAECRKALSLKEDEEHVPHNLVLCEKHMIVIPRRSGVFGNASANAAGMVGSAWVLEHSMVEEWRTLGPRRVLQGLGVPNSRAET